ncbi:molecular chaperone DnaK [Paenibacillus mesophilus]|uniref:TraR/DksA C4-type zinc finger protein n=1 Tax=Paenibacillus mesophilus TaxID=2582849 RepID=UPI00110E7050|nr:TraR/DksA C4-type zinc finger protein [Paenibacillus mesophilus]TMV46642.1 molecular chaperone DnaK [Paenibacillus mesophilus]
MNVLTNEQRAALTELLEQERDSLERRIRQNDHFGSADPLSATTGELSSYDNHPADLGSEVFERGKDIALNEHEEHHLSEVMDALERMKEGTYGKCAICGTAIPYERLQAVPDTEYCFEHVPDREISQRRPAEEKLLEPPFGRTSMDELTEETEFDGEDAWQIVESWGNSDSPAMAEDAEVHDYNSMYVEADENEGFVEPYESFVATDLYGQHVTVVRNRQYREYMEHNEGDPLLEPDPYRDVD